MTILHQFTNHVRSQSLIKKNDTVIVGISGGCDSMALIHLLNEVKHNIGFQIIMAHFNHKLRPSSDQDEKIVSDFAEQWNIPIEKAVWKNAPNSRDSKIEQKARQQRQKFFTKLIKQYNAQSIALAHHQDDIAETILMKLIRGTGNTGLTGIAADRIIDNVRYIRPLLNFSKNDLIKLCKKKNITYHDDPTNTDTKFLRNKIRHHLLPLIEKEYNDKIKSALLSNASIVSGESEFLDTHCDGIYRKLAVQKQKNITFDRKKFTHLHIALQRRLVRKTFCRLTGSTNKLAFNHIERLINSLSTETKVINCPLTKGVSAQIFPDNITFCIN